MLRDGKLARIYAPSTHAGHWRKSGMIARHWKGVAHAEKADNYIEHLTIETFPALRKIDGFMDASILKRKNANGVEFLIVTRWRSMEAIRRFAGESANVAVVPIAVQAMMIEYDKEVAHYEVVEEFDGGSTIE